MEALVFNRHTRSKLLLCSGASLCLIVAGTAAFAEANIPDAAALTASLKSPLGALKEAQDIYAKEFGMVSVMPGGSLAPREKAIRALVEIKSKVLEARNSDKIPGSLVKDTLTAIDEAETALLTDGAQTIAYSLGTVGQEIQAIESKVQTSSNPVQAASSEPAQTQPQQNAQATPEQLSQKLAANDAKPTEPQPALAQREAQAAKPSNEPAAKTAEAQPSPSQQASIANHTRNDIVGKTLYDAGGNEVAKIQDVKTGPDGKIAAAEIDVGGFLGIGSRRIPVPADQLEMKGDRVQARSLTEEQIKNLPHEAK